MTPINSVPLFDELADRYDEVLPFFASFGAKLVDLIDPTPRSDLLDIGAGRGAVAAQAHRRGCRVVAVDGAPGMVRRLSGDQPAIDVQLMDAHELRFADDTFDVAVGAFVIHCVAEPSRLLAEAQRVVRPRGVVAMSVPGPAEDGGRWDRFNAIGASFVPQNDRPAVAQPVDVPMLFGNYGLINVVQHNLQIRLPVESPRQFWDFQLSHGFAGYLRSLTPDDQSEYQQRAFAELQDMQDSGGIELIRGAEVTIGRVPD